MEKLVPLLFVARARVDVRQRAQGTQGKPPQRRGGAVRIDVRPRARLIRSKQSAQSSLVVTRMGVDQNHPLVDRCQVNHRRQHTVADIFEIQKSASIIFNQQVE